MSIETDYQSGDKAPHSKRAPHSKGAQSQTLTPLLQDLLARFEVGDGLFLFYFIAIVRQWFWIIDNSLAWIATIPTAIALWIFYVRTKDQVERERNTSFWFIVGLPLLVAYLIRFPFPDSSFDVWGLRLFHGYRGLRGFIYLPGEFFPTAAPFNPTPDMITAMFRCLLGYRLGTVVNLLAMLWTAWIIQRLLRPVIGDPKLRSLSVLVIVFVEHLLFEINNYMPDLLALPVLLEATRLGIHTQRVDRRSVVRIAFLISVAVTLKLSNGAVAMPIVLIWAWRSLRAFRPRELLITTSLSLVVFVAPLLVFSVWVYKLTGSPIFPLYNKVFRSPLYPPFNGWDNRWGGYGVVEILEWPVLMFFEPVRTAELPVYSGRLSVGFVLALLCLLFFPRIDRMTRQLVFIIVVGTLLWSVTMGYIRYGLYLEVLSGILAVNLAVTMFRKQQRDQIKSYVHIGLGILLSIVLVAQSVMAGVYVMHREWSMRPTVFDDPNGYKREWSSIFHDRAIRNLLPDRERALLDGVDVWIVSGVKTSGLMPFLNDRAKVIGIRAGGLFLAPGTREALGRSLDAFAGKEMASIALPPDYEEALFALRNVGLNVRDVTEITIPFFSQVDLFPAYFFEVTSDHVIRRLPTRTRCLAILSRTACRAEITALDSTTVVKAGQQKNLFITVRNVSEEAWPSQAADGGENQILLNARWLSANGATVISEGGQTGLPYDFLPGDSTVLALDVKAPNVPGTYLLEFDMIQRGTGAFKDKGSKPLQIKMTVEPN